MVPTDPPEARRALRTARMLLAVSGVAVLVVIASLVVQIVHLGDYYVTGCGSPQEIANGNYDCDNYVSEAMSWLEVMLVPMTLIALWTAFLAFFARYTELEDLVPWVVTVVLSGTLVAEILLTSVVLMDPDPPLMAASPMVYVVDLVGSAVCLGALVAACIMLSVRQAHYARSLRPSAAPGS